MTLYQLVASLVSSLAWPVTLTALLAVFRRPLTRLLSNDHPGLLLRRVKAGPVELEWESTLDEAAREVAEAVGPDAEVRALTAADPSVEDLLALADSYPMAAVMLAFQRVEAAFYGALKARDLLPEERRVPLRTATLTARQAGLVTPELASAIDNLGKLRNQVAHGSAEDVTPGRAAQYAFIASAIVSALKRQAD